MTAIERDVVRGHNVWKKSVEGLGGLSGPIDIPSFLISSSVYTLCLFGVSVVFETLVVNSRRAEGGLLPCAGIEGPKLPTC